MSSKSKSKKFDFDSSLKFLKSPKDIQPTFQISDDEWKVIAQIQPGYSIKQIANLTKMSMPKIQSVVEHLVENNIIEVLPDNARSAEHVLDDWYLRVTKNQQAHYLLSSKYRSIHYWLGIPTIFFSAIIGSTLLTGSNDQLLKTILGVLSLVVTCLTALQTFLRPSEQAEKHKLAAAQLGTIRREIEKLKAFPVAKSEHKILMEKIKESIDKTTQEAPDLPPNIWVRLENVDGKDRQLSLINKLIARIRSL